jgi:hypothetical protein
MIPVLVQHRGMRKSALVYLFVAACGGGGGGGGVDAKQPDAPPGGKTFHISGTASQQSASGGMPAPGVTVAAFANAAPGTAVTMTTTDASGNYMLTVNSPTTTLDGFLKATKTGNVDTYLEPPAPLTMDFMMASINELDTNLFAGLNGTGLGNSSCGNSATQALIVIEVFDTAMMPVAGVAVTSSPAASKVGYTGGLGLPDFTLTSTQADGRAFVCGLPDGAVSLMGTKTGATFKTTMAKAHVGAFTTTLVTE